MRIKRLDTPELKRGSDRIRRQIYTQELSTQVTNYFNEFTTMISEMIDKFNIEFYRYSDADNPSHVRLHEAYLDFYEAELDLVSKKRELIAAIQGVMSDQTTRSQFRKALRKYK